MRFSDTKNKLSDNGNGSIVAFIAIVSIGLLLALPTINAFPAYVHAWSQSDWYSIAIGFQNNGFDFFHPETLIYNKQYPGWWAVNYGDTITSVDFPIHNYIVALLMTLLGTTAPWVFRLWTLLCSLGGAWFLFLLAKRLTQSTWKSLLAVMIYMTAPVYAYYFAGFIPSAPSLALVIAGMWAYVRFWQGEGTRWWHWAMTLLAMAALIRTSQSIILIAVCGYETLRILMKEGCREGVAIGKMAVSAALAFASIAGYYFWNRHLAEMHGTMFLGELRPPESWEQCGDLLEKIKNNWRWQYFTRLQQWILMLTAVAALVWTLARRKKDERSRRLSLGWLLGAYWIGESCFFYVMMVQFENHDYYFLDSFFLPCILLFIMALRNLPQAKERWQNAAGAVVLVLLGGIMFNGAKHSNASRCNYDDHAYRCSLNYEGADRWLDSLGVSRDARILSVFSYPQNSPFIQMGRKGYSLMWYDKEIIDAALEFPYDYAVVEDQAFRDNFASHKRLLGRLKRLAGNGTLSLCILEDTIVNDVADDFFMEPAFVGIRNGRFWLNGEVWFPVMLNYKAFFDGDRVIPAPYYTGTSLREHFDAIASWGFNAVRVCLDVMGEGDSTAKFEATRRMVQAADSAGLRVMLLIKTPFEPYWQSYTKGLLRHLADLPALWAYDFFNEPLYFDPVPDRDKLEAVRIVAEWRHWVRSYAPHQLFTVATAEPIEVFEWDPSMLPVDFVEMHTYHPLRVKSEMWWYSHYCGKPWMIGETGLPADGDSVPYGWQSRFLMETMLWAKQLGAVGYGWWEFQDCHDGVNFEAQYTGLRNSQGQRKPAVFALKKALDHCSEANANCQPPVNYNNMLAYSNIRVTGRVIDKDSGHPVEGAVVRGWNDDWSVGMNTFTDRQGRFTLYSNDYNVHFEISAPRMSRQKFDKYDIKYTNVGTLNPDSLPHREREYQQIDYRQYMNGYSGKQTVFNMDFDPLHFTRHSLQGDMGTIKLHHLKK